MIVKFAAANQAYVIVSGRELIDIDGKRLFSSMDELRNALASKGLEMKRERGEYRVRCTEDA